MRASPNLRAWALVHLALFALAAIIFTLWPGIDLAAAKLFFHDGRWLGSERAGVEGFRRLAAILVFGVPVVAVLLWLLGRVIGRPTGGRAAIVLALSLALGPGLIINGILKEHWGRARPSQTAEFGRDKIFTPALRPTDQCERNCSFASGEAALGFGLTALALVIGRSVWLIPGLVLGVMLALVRMAAGGHFLSDVIFGGLIASATGLAVYALVYRRQAEA
ncbi:MAG: phosphatase PAP2 family protein [Alphaproteobacteria bacterium]|nr:phosphatase PAP2 family protein [Alphaproteobacteria bacterium]